MSEDASFVPLFIEGQRRPSSTGATFEVRSPADGSVVSVAAAASADDCQDAVEAAGKAFVSWSSTTPAFRANILRKAAEVMASSAYAEKIVALNIQEAGISEYFAGFVDVAVSKIFLMQAATLPYKVKGEILSSDLGNQAFVYKQPMGVIFVMAPWNAPLTLVLRAALPAIAVGNTVVVRTSELSPACQLLAAEVFSEAGLPNGVLNIIHTSRQDAGPRVREIIAHPLVRKIAFTGSDNVGRIIAAEAAKHLKPCIFELGGKAASVVLADADIDAAARGIVDGAMLSTGQTCLSTERAIVMRDVAAEFIDKVKEVTSRLKVGKGCKLGPLISESAAARVLELIREPVEGGAELVVGDMVHNGTYLQPHVVFGVKRTDRLWREESFGPVLSIVVADTIDHAVELANDTTYTLAASVWATDLRKALEVSRRIRASKLVVNQSTVGMETGFNPAPFGGSSGYGVFDADAFLDTQLVSIAPVGPRKFPLVDT